MARKRTGAKGELPRGVSLDKRSGRYIAQYSDVNKQKKREYYKTKSEAQTAAKERRSQVKRLRVEGERPVKPGARDVVETLAAYLAEAKALKRAQIYHYVSFAEMWGAQFDGMDLADVTAQHIRDWRTAALERGFVKGNTRREYKPAGLNRPIAFLKAFFNWCKEQEYVDRNPVDAVASQTEDNERTRFLTVDRQGRDEEQLLKEHFDAAMWIMPLVAMDIGPRTSEQLRMRREHVHFDRNQIEFPKSKNGYPRHVPMTKRVRDLLEQHLASHDSEWVFPSPRLKGKPATWYYYRGAWEGALAKAEITDFHWHDLRHTFCSRLIMSGAEPVTVMRLAGHRSLSMVARYAHLSPGFCQDAIERMHAKFGR